MSDFEFIILLSAIVGLYAVIANRLMVFGGRFRMRALELAQPLLSNSRVTAVAKRQIEDDLATLPNWLPAWAIAFSITPAAISFSLRGLRKCESDLQEHFRSRVPASLEKTYSDFLDATFFAWLSNSPAAALLTAVQFIFWSFFISSTVLVDAVVERVANRISRDGADGAAPVRIPR